MLNECAADLNATLHYETRDGFKPLSLPAQIVTVDDQHRLAVNKYM